MLAMVFKGRPHPIGTSLPSPNGKDAAAGRGALRWPDDAGETATDDELPSEAIFDLVASAFEADLLVGTGFQVKLWQCRVATAVHLGCMDAAQHYPARACCVAQDTVRQLAVAQGSPALADCTLNVVAFQHKFEV